MILFQVADAVRAATGKSIIICNLVEMGKKIETTKPAAKSKKTAAIAVTTEPSAPLQTLPAEQKPAKKSLKKPAAKSKPAFTNDDVALRAYFIAEKRHKLGLPGDAHHDWIEAEKQLLAESRKKQTTKKAKKA